MLRKHILTSPATVRRRASEKDIAAIATVLVTSEDPHHPIEHAFDDQRGPGGSRWIAAESGAQTLILAFDVPQTIQAVHVEIEEPDVTRTQEMDVAVSADGGQTYRELVRQQYNFSPPGTTIEREDWSVSADRTTHFRLRITPDKGGKDCRATLTALTLE